MKVVVAICEDDYQIVGVAINDDEARSMTDEYIVNGPKAGYVPPEYFDIWERVQHGWEKSRLSIEA